MISVKRLTFVVICIGLFCVASGSPVFAQNQDVIFRLDTGKKMSVERVTAETYQEVRYKKGSKELRLTADKVGKVTYYDAPQSWENGLTFASKGEYENAINSFKLAMEQKGVRDWIKTYAQLEIAKVYQQWGLSSKEKFSEAVKAYQDLLTQNPETRFYAQVLYNLAKSYAGSGDLAGALKTFDELAQQAYDKKLGVIWEARAKFERAVAQLEGGAFDEAVRDLRSAGTFASEQLKSAKDSNLTQELTRIEGLAKLHQGSVMIKKKKFADATRFFNEIMRDDANSREVKAGAECGLGECLLAEKKLKEAQYQFARTKVLYGDLAEQGAKATYFLGVICLDLKEKEPGYKKRAKEYFTEVVNLYPDSNWANMARAKLGELG